MGWGVSQSSVGLIGAQEPETEKLPLYFSERGFGVHRWAALVNAASLTGVKNALVLFAAALRQRHPRSHRYAVKGAALPCGSKCRSACN